MEEETTTEALNFWNKKPDDMSVGDTLIASGVIVTACVAAPFVVVGAIYAGEAAWRKIRKISLPKVPRLHKTHKA
jgi:hypothetical protein